MGRTIFFFTSNKFILSTFLALFMISGPDNFVLCQKPPSVKDLVLYDQYLRWIENQTTNLKELSKIARSKKTIKAITNNLHQVSLLIQKYSTTALSDRHHWKNRTKRFVPYDENRTGRELEGFYLNASDVICENQSYIVAQGPLAFTVMDFWKAIIFRKSSLIISLTMPIEKGTDKCAHYWDENNFPQPIDQWDIACADVDIIGISKKYPSQRIIKRVFIAKNQNTREKRFVTHLHYENWEDGGIPDQELFHELLEEVCKLQIPNNVPITVHCSAGVGRSGTFVAAYSLKKFIRSEMNFGKKPNEIILNIPKTVYNLREQRPHMVGSSNQLRVVYQTVVHEANLDK